MRCRESLQRQSPDGDPTRDWGITGEVWNVSMVGDREPRNLSPIPVPLLPMALPWGGFFSSHCPHWPSSQFCLQCPCLSFLNCQLGSSCSKAGVCGLPQDSTTSPSLISVSVKYCMGNSLQSRLRVAHGHHWVDMNT